MSRRSRNITVREGTSERNWYVLAGHVALSILLTGYVGIMFFETGAFAAGVTIAVALLVLFVASIAAAGALFRDAAYLRGTTGRWNPDWWYYLGGGFGIPVLAGVATNVLFSGGMGYGIGMIGIGLCGTAMSTVYLYRRHKFIGVP